MSGSQSYALKHPVTIKYTSSAGEREELISEVSLRRIKGKDLRAIGGLIGESVIGLRMIERLTGLDAQFVDEIDAEDIEAMGTIIEGFTKPGP